MEVQAMHTGASGISGTNAMSFGAMFLQAFGIPTSGEGAMNPADFDGFALSPTGSPNADATKGYLNYLYFDKDMNFITAGFDGITASANTSQTLSLSLSIDQEGFVFVYVTNEEPTAKDIYFDDLKVTHTPTIIAQTDSYYPFGLSHGNMSYVREGRRKNQFLYNGKELVEGFNLGWYDYGARYYAPDLGRWHAVDPLADKYAGLTPYNYVANSPLKLIDPDGRQLIVHYTEQKRDRNGNLMYRNNGQPRMIHKEVVLSISEGCIVAKDSQGNNINNDFVNGVVGSLNYVKDFEGNDLIEEVINDQQNLTWIEEISSGEPAFYDPMFQTVG